ncbi:CPBP family intramembrane glutamic endopeptidase [Maricaulis sp.]|uniref:CPBP family intramembrane glutamic endopeptidase n=1 Tax=Maricaulis sp. TaxID=1486257 RepID=UPI003A935AF2
MSTDITERRKAWTTIIIFLVIVTGLSAVFHYAIVNLNPTSLYVGPLMWCPALAAFATLAIRRRKLSSLPWRWGKWRFNLGAFAMPILYVAIAYGLIWGLGLGGFPDPETLAEWAGETGLEVSTPVLIAVMVVLTGTIGCIRAASTIVGEEIGWRGFFVWELRKVMPFGAVALFSGVIWAFWHWPIVVFYGGGEAWLQMSAFTVMIAGMSVMMTYFTFKSGSLWPAVFFHAAHNVYFDKLFNPLTIDTGHTSLWTGEYGLMMPAVTTVLGVIFWRKAKAEGL